MKSVKVVALSDLHGTLPKAKEFPRCDIVCICGDIVPLDYQKDTVRSIAWFTLTFNAWANSLPCKKVVFIGGNHDFFLQEISANGTIRAKTVMKMLFPGNEYSKTKLVYLCDNGTTIKINDAAVKLYGTPWIADLSRWAFYKKDDELKDKFDKIPNNIDILLTHMPSTIGDTGVVLQHTAFNAFKSYGSYHLGQCISSRNIKYALCGHVHTGNHEITELETGCKVVNVSIKDEDYVSRFKPFEFELPYEQSRRA